MAESRSTEGRAARWAAALARTLHRLGPSEQLAAIGASLIVASVVLPWYGAPGRSELAQTGLGAFGFATAALLVVAAAILWLLIEIGRGYEPPRPLGVGGLLIGSGAWAGLIVLYLMLDRPDLAIDEERGSTIRYGLVLALCAAVAIVAAGVRRRATDAGRRARQRAGDQR